MKLKTKQKIADSLRSFRMPRYLEIPEIIGECMERIEKIDAPNVDEILATEANVYELIESRW